ncbi:MAG: hypothetical protein V2I76_00225, partial [Roseobacter sp.]|nr:hypothetical protein [Roseobacter sp.]
EILQEVSAQEADIRADTGAWLNGFLTMAYQPLDLDTLQALVDFSATSGGRALNSALFAGFEEVNKDISYALGRAIALNAQGDEI